jgi:hypothetical protein
MSKNLQIRSAFTKYGGFSAETFLTNPASYSSKVPTLKQLDFFPVFVNEQEVLQEIMTIALCLNCGETKFGALCPCAKCGVESTGNIQLDIAFSDHHVADDSLKDLGKVIAHFSNRTDDRGVAFWAFIRYVSENHNSILHANIPNEYAERVAAIYAESDIPSVTLNPSFRVPSSDEKQNEAKANKS